MSAHKALLQQTFKAVGALAVIGPLLYYSGMWEPINPGLVHKWDSAFFLYVAMALSEGAMTLTRRQYKLCERFRDEARRCKFFTTSVDADPAAKGAVMKALYASFPSTVSEMEIFGRQ